MSVVHSAPLTKQSAPPAPSRSDGPAGSVVHFSAHEVFIVDPGTTYLKIEFTLCTNAV